MCDVLPHLLASEKMTVSNSSAESQSGEDKEVCKTELLAFHGCMTTHLCFCTPKCNLRINCLLLSILSFNQI